MLRGSALALLVALPSAAEGPLPDPIPEGSRAVELVDFVLVPPSSSFRPLARINLLTHAGDGSGRLFVNDMRGRIWVIDDGAPLPVPFLDVAAALGGTLDTRPLQRGLVTFAFHPDYANPAAPGFGKLYTSTSEIPGSDPPDFAHPLGAVDHLGVVSEWSVDPADPNRVDPLSRRVLLRTAQPSGDHTVSQLAFDPNAVPGDSDYGMLYIAVGDGGGYVPRLGDEIDPARVGQDTTNPFGSLLRIDPLGGSTPEYPTNGAYGIPRDNPFARSHRSLREIWAFGFRNPHRFSWDVGGGAGPHRRGAMLISDIGQDLVEEIDVGRRGANYGWSEREGSFVPDRRFPESFEPLPRRDPAFRFRYPAAQYDHDDGFAVVGGFVARGGLVPELDGQYVFGDNNGRIFYADARLLALRDAIAGHFGRPLAAHSPIRELRLFYQGVETTLLEILGEPRRADLRFGRGGDGAIYVLTKRDGMIRVIRPLAHDDGDDLVDGDDGGPWLKRDEALVVPPRLPPRVRSRTMRPDVERFGSIVVGASGGSRGKHAGVSDRTPEAVRAPRPWRMAVGIRAR